MRCATSPFLTATLAFMVACSGGAPVEVEVTPEVPAKAEIKITDAATNAALVPSPLETQRALDAASISIELKSLIGDRSYKMSKSDADQAALRTGVVLADLLLTVKTSDAETLKKQLGLIRQGMTALEGGRDIDSVLSDIIERVNADALSRDELLKEFDELSGVVIPELEFNGNGRIVPLIKAGSWLEGANLLAKAAKEANNAAAADGLLKQPAVVSYFIEYVKTEGSDKAPAEVTTKLEASLTTLKGLAEKTEPLTTDDLDTVIKVTNDVLALL